MRDLPPDLAARLAEGATTLCHCWALRRRDGLALGFTDHDRDLTLGDLVHAARTGLEAAEASRELGFAVSGGDVAGALSALGLTEADIAGGLYDGASVETWLVDWTNPEIRLLLDLGTLGEIRRAGNAFVAELRGLMDSLDAERGRTYRATCGADLGDGRCRVDLAPLRVAATVRAVPRPGLLALDLARPVPDGALTGGHFTWTGGANAGLAGDVRAHADGAIELWEAPPRAVAPGDALLLDPGCDKRLATCAGTFANAVNFQGFPHLPGNDVVLRQVPGSGPGLDGGSLFRAASDT
ncbi:DUF2163 domain-containing protein [Methylobacterium soli]|uniref:DUF2163 domain-containing protein n=1 Tax=Methylobacterium soli TaxID=553447 RepID=A0A6L3T1H6_9HYPH|nr:DUF2163 domain-containing protein [Methylobacterium soli]KAB1076932.1 DUF2163 domain-containing protein [Methylobacterium soli]GJE41915.1 hypothetical protein AEGHOMDF_1085 [Methylobacterium soli]